MGKNKIVWIGNLPLNAETSEVFLVSSASPSCSTLRDWNRFTFSDIGVDVEIVVEATTDPSSAIVLLVLSAERLLTTLLFLQ